MEPFGLFQFLKNILSQPDQSLEKNAVEQADCEQKNTPTVAADGVENAEEPQRNAFVDFVQAHDARASKLKR